MNITEHQWFNCYRMILGTFRTCMMISKLLVAINLVL